MSVFRYSLDKSSKKHICPNCNKRTFVLYIDTETNEYLPTDFGRCDREQNCNYHKAPPKGKRAYLIGFLSLNSISNKAYKMIDLNGVISIIPKSQILEQTAKECWITEWFLKTSIINYLNNESKYFKAEKSIFFNETKTKETPTLKEPSYHSHELHDKLIREYDSQRFDDNLTTYLLKIFTFDEVQKATQDYYVTGTNYYWNNSTIFWQIDNDIKIHAGKIMLYDRFTGKRIKQPYNHINWLHNALKEPDFNLQQCLFGLHLVNEDYQKDIGLVESEKTAILMSIILPQYIWIASGSKVNFKNELLNPLQKRNVFAFPDKGEFTNWLNKANELNLKGFKISVSDLLEQTDFENGFDLADYYLQEKI